MLNFLWLWYFIYQAVKVIAGREWFFLLLGSGNL